jgi:hypothetical protein
MEVAERFSKAHTSGALDISWKTGNYARKSSIIAKVGVFHLAFQHFKGAPSAPESPSVSDHPIFFLTPIMISGLM